jgi:hypothetical protein
MQDEDSENERGALLITPTGVAGDRAGAAAAFLAFSRSFFT